MYIYIYEYIYLYIYNLTMCACVCVCVCVCVCLCVFMQWAVHPRLMGGLELRVVDDFSAQIAGVPSHAMIDEVLNCWRMRPSAPSVCGLKLLVYAVLSC
jgi:hypothetical protein